MTNIAQRTREMGQVVEEYDWTLKDFERDWGFYSVLKDIRKAAMLGEVEVTIHLTLNDGMTDTLLSEGFSIVEEHDRTTISWEE